MRLIRSNRLEVRNEGRMEKAEKEARVSGFVVPQTLRVSVLHFPVLILPSFVWSHPPTLQDKTESQCSGEAVGRSRVA